MSLDRGDLRLQGLNRLRRLRIRVLDEVGGEIFRLSLTSLRLFENGDLLDVFGHAAACSAADGPQPRGKRVEELPILRRPGFDAGSVPVNRAVELRECPAFDLGAGSQLELLDRHFEPHPFPRRRQVAKASTLGRPVLAEVDQVPPQ